MKQEYLLLGEIVRPQGIRGEVKVRHYTDDPDRFHDLEIVFLKRGDSYEQMTVTDSRVQGDDVHVALAQDHPLGAAIFRKVESKSNTD